MIDNPLPLDIILSANQETLHKETNMGGPGSGRRKGSLSKTKKSVLKKTSYGKAVKE